MRFRPLSRNATTSCWLRATRLTSILSDCLLWLCPTACELRGKSLMRLVRTQQGHEDRELDHLRCVHRAAAQFHVALHSVISLRGSKISIPERLAAARRFLSKVASGKP